MWILGGLFRSILKDKKYFLLNILGLGLGLAAFLLIFLWIRFQTSFDRFHENYSNIYQINYQNAKSGERWAGSPSPLAPAISGTVSGINAAARVRPLPDFAFQFGDNMFYERNGMSADPQLFDIFSFKSLHGDAKTALESPENIVITRSFAKRYFGDKDAINEKFFVEAQGYLTVKAVIDDLPANSHIQFDYLVSHRFVEAVGLCGLEWGDPNFRTFILVEPSTNIESLTLAIEQVARTHNCFHIVSGDHIYYLRPLEKIYLDYEISNWLGESGDYRSLFIFGSIGLLVLLLACINYINLSLSLFSKKSASTSIKRLCGAERKTIFFSHLSETLIIVLISFLFAIAVISILKPVFITLVGQKLQFTLEPLHALFVAGTFLFTTLVCGVYPALQLSGVAAMHLWQSKRAKNKMMRTLVVVQNSISIALIICTLIIARQLQYIQNKDLGFSKNQIAYVVLRGQITNQADVLKSKMLQHPAVQQIAFKDCLPHSIRNNTLGIQWKIDGKVMRGGEHNIGSETTRIDYNYFEMMDVEFVDGRNFDPALATDVENYIINEEAARQMGLTNPVGNDFARYGAWGKIVGVIKDTHFKSLHEKVHPQTFHLFKDIKSQGYFSAMFFKLAGDDTPGFIKELQRHWSELNPGIPFEYHFLDQDYENIYKNDRRTAHMLSVFTMLAIFIACLGLVGQSQIAADNRTKEIGIRKVNGASSGSILYLLNRDFIVWIVVAFALACSAAYFGMQLWLRNFAYHTTMHAGLFILAGLISLVISLGVVSIQVFKAARTKPVDSLRYE